MRLLKFGRAALGALALVWSASGALAQDTAANYPNRPIKVIVPFAAGGGNDILARLVGQKAGEILGQSFIIESAAFTGLNRVERQRKIYAALGDLMHERVHALTIKAKAPGEG